MKKSRRDSRKCTIMVSKDIKFEMKKYKRIEDITGDHLNINVNLLMQPPAAYSINDWLIVNLIDFLHRVELLYSSCSLFCTSDTCPLFNSGPQYCYFWVDDDSPHPVQVSAPEYFNALKRYIKRNLLDKELFPDKAKELSKKADGILKTSYRRLFRILAHLYICHYQDISNIHDLNIFELMNTVLTHYVNFTLLFGVCQLDEFHIFEPVFKAINQNPNPNFHCPKFSNIK
ncbi:Maintenance of ploidy protein mob2 [Tritrichomonas musculus]|uniref:Maintenance of ploidy protein mob2 n=1 Tax=Tritrichomonas musculus TaxID=1915356 RepID=A0ABR2GY54_9EUKA